MERDVNPLQSRYLQLSARFKAAWAFQQLLRGLFRMDPEVPLGIDPSTFQGLFNSLKQVSRGLNGPAETFQPLTSKLSEIAEQMDGVYAVLLAEDHKISPPQIRHYLESISDLDERQLIEIVRFYGLAHRGTDMQATVVDKVDLLLTRLAMHVAGERLDGDTTRLGKVLTGLAESAGSEPLPAAAVGGLQQQLRQFRTELRLLRSFDELADQGLVQRYRELKHGLGGGLFDPTLLPLVVETNCWFRRRIDELTGGAAVPLTEGYHRLEEFHQPLEAESEPVVDPGALLLGEEIEAADPVAASSGEDSALLPDLGLLQPHWKELLVQLSRSDHELPPEEASTAAGLRPYRLEAREVVAFRRLSTDEPCDRRLERFLLAAAALRWRMSEEVRELHGAISERPDRLAPEALASARRSLRAADAFLWHLSHLLEAAVSRDDPGEGRQLQLLRMRMMREYSGLWLLLHRFESAGAGRGARGRRRQARDRGGIGEQGA